MESGNKSGENIGKKKIKKTAPHRKGRQHNQAWPNSIKVASQGKEQEESYNMYYYQSVYIVNY